MCFKPHPRLGPALKEKTTITAAYNTIQLFVATEVEEEPEEEAEGDFEEDLIAAPDDCEACYGAGVAYPKIAGNWVNIPTRFIHIHSLLCCQRGFQVFGISWLKLF